MAQKKVFSAQKTEMPFDLTIKGEQVRVEPGTYVLLDQAGNVELVDEETYNNEYGENDTDAAEAEPKGGSKKKSRAKSATKEEPPVEFESNVEPIIEEDAAVPGFFPAESAEQLPVTEGEQGDTDGN